MRARMEGSRKGLVEGCHSIQKEGKAQGAKTGASSSYGERGGRTPGQSLQKGGSPAEGGLLNLKDGSQRLRTAREGGEELNVQHRDTQGRGIRKPRGKKGWQSGVDGVSPNNPNALTNYTY